MAMKQQSLAVWMNNEVIKRKFIDLLGTKANAFMSAALTIYNSSRQLQECDTRSIVGALGLAATLNLSITPSLGQAYVVPFKGKAQFQIGVKGMIQLAHRTGQYQRIHAGKIHEGEIQSFHPLTGEPILGERISDRAVGYIAYFRLINGFEKYLYMTVEEIEAHAERYSQSYSYDKRNGKNSSPWSTNFEAMACKTVLKKLLTTWGILSTEMAEAMQGDQSVVDKNTFTYVDNGESVQSREEIFIPETDMTDKIDMETGEVLGVES